MQFRNAWTRGLCYGSIFGGAIGVVPCVLTVIGKVPLTEVALAGGVTTLIWSGPGFLAGFASRKEPLATTNFVAIEPPTPFRRYLYRFVAGLLLSYIADMVVVGLGMLMLFLWAGDFSGAAPRPQSGEAVFVAIAALISMETAAVPILALAIGVFTGIATAILFRMWR